MKTPVNKMTHAQHFKLCTWLQGRPLVAADTQVALAVEASEASGEAINRFHIKAALETLELEIPEAPKEPEQKVDILIREFERLAKELNYVPTAEFDSIFKSL